MSRKYTNVEITIDIAGDPIDVGRLVLRRPSTEWAKDALALAKVPKVGEVLTVCVPGWQCRYEVVGPLDQDGRPTGLFPLGNRPIPEHPGFDASRHGR